MRNLADFSPTCRAHNLSSKNDFEVLLEAKLDHFKSRIRPEELNKFWHMKTLRNRAGVNEGETEISGQ